MKCYRAMSVKRFSVEDERLGIDFNDGIRPVFIKGETKNGMFHIRTEDFETFPELSDKDRTDIRRALQNSNIIID